MHKWWISLFFELFNCAIIRPGVKYLSYRIKLLRVYHFLCASFVCSFWAVSRNENLKRESETRNWCRTKMQRIPPYYIVIGACETCRTPDTLMIFIFVSLVSCIFDVYLPSNSRSRERWPCTWVLFADDGKWSRKHVYYHSLQPLVRLLQCLSIQSWVPLVHGHIHVNAASMSFMEEASVLIGIGVYVAHHGGDNRSF